MWLLLLLPLLALLLFGLRSCWPGLGLGGLNAPAFDVPGQNLPADGGVTHLGLPGGNGLSVTGHGAGTGTGTGAALPADGTAPGTQNPLGGAPEGAIPPATEPGASNSPGAPETTPPEAGTEHPAAEAPPAELQAQQPPAPPELPPDAQAQAQAPQLTIPPEAGDGAADFLNGKYNGAGIQEVGTGKSLRLKYDFQNGKGQATVSRSDGVRCNAPVAASMSGGTLSINSEGQAACADGSSYELPQVNCKPGAQSVADCKGNYGAKDFDMLMKPAGQ